MTLSPKKLISNLTSTTVNRGVEAKEIEIADIRLDINESSGSQSGAEASCACASEPPAPAPAGTAPQDTSSSYVQVVVHKHRRGCGRASSPLPARDPPRAPPDAAAAGGAGDAQIAAPVKSFADHGITQGRRETPVSKKYDGLTEDELASDSEPECVEVYYFERGDGSCLAAPRWGGWGGPRGRTATERAWRRARRPARRAVRELLAAPRLLALLPIALSLHVLRCVLSVARRLVTGTLQAAADGLLKPALAATFNALVAPPLACAGHSLRAARDALRPLWGALGDALEPAARTLGHARLVSVHLHAPAPAPAATCCRCDCARRV